MPTQKLVEVVTVADVDESLVEILVFADVEILKLVLGHINQVY